MDEMQLPDVATMNRFTQFGYIISWQQTREIMLASLRPYLKNQDITSQELLPLPIDEDNKEKLTKEISNSDVDRFRKFASKFKNNKGGQ